MFKNITDINQFYNCLILTRCVLAMFCGTGGAPGFVGWGPWGQGRWAPCDRFGGGGGGPVGNSPGPWLASGRGCGTVGTRLRGGGDAAVCRANTQRS